MRHLASLALLAVAFAACSSDQERSEGQSSFASAPPNGADRGGASAGDGTAGGDAGPNAPGDSAGGGTRTVEETDLYRLDGNRLYYLNGYRGLMVFDVTDPDHPALLGRSPIYGWPVDMIIRNGIAVVVIGDWYGTMDDGTPFHGSIVRGLDATDPAHIRVLGEAKLGGWVRDDRVVGDVLYAVSEDYGWSYDWAASSVSQSRPTVIVSSVSFAGGKIEAVDRTEFPSFEGVFHVTPDAILLAFPLPFPDHWGTTSLRYLDISDPGGTITERGSLTVNGAVNGWGADNGRWNLDFADGKTAHVLGQSYGYGGYVLSTVDFANPDAPVLSSTLSIPRTGWSVAARFDANRLYLSPASDFYDGSGTTAFQVYDLTSPTAPRLAGTVTVPGSVWNLVPAPGSRIFALGSGDWRTGEGSPVTLHYLDVSDPAAPQLLGTSVFGQGWAWTPAAGTFKAFTMDAARGLVVLPFSGWDRNGGYNNGLQLIEFTPTRVATAGAARTKGWVERGIFVGNRLVSLSNVSLAVVDYTDALAPRVVTEVTLARNIVAAQPSGNAIAEVSSDWWDNDTDHSQIRMLPIAAAEETSDTATAVPTLDIEGVGARVFSNGHLLYVVTSVRTDVACPGSTSGCFQRAQQVQIIDLVNGAAVARGKIQLPADSQGWWGWGWEDFWWWDWWGGRDVVQVGGDALAFRRWAPVYDGRGNYVASTSKLYVVDLANPDAPGIASLVMLESQDGWWGNLKVVGDTLYSTRYEWLDDPRSDRGWVRYYLDRIDLSDRSRPRVRARINVPGLLVGGNAADPSIVYTIDYRWDGEAIANDFDAVRIQGSTAILLSHTTIRGWVGATFVRGTTAYLSAEQYSDNRARVDLHAIDLANPARPRDRIASDTGWGWLLDVVGDRALVTSGWGGLGIDIYRLRDGKAPVFDRTVRVRGWSFNSVSQQDQTLFLASGYWGVQAIPLQ